jgi:hypothetical protein
VPPSYSDDAITSTSVVGPAQLGQGVGSTSVRFQAAYPPTFQPGAMKVST